MAAPPPPAPWRRSWADIPAASLHEILTRVPCPVDRSRALLACDAWRASAALLPPPDPPRPLPWLLLPAAPFPDGPARAACVLSGCAVHRHLAVRPPGARCFGSHDGAWLFLASRQARGHELVNARTGRVHVLPGVLRHPQDQEGPHALAPAPGAPQDRGMVILAAALSAPPGDPLCVAAAIVDTWADPDADPVPDPAAVAAAAPPLQRRLAFWTMGRRVALDFGPACMVDDVAYLHGSFLFLTHGGDSIRVGAPVQHHDGGLDAQWDERRFVPSGRGYEPFVRARYLLESRGELLLVVRLTNDPAAAVPWTSVLKVFVAIERQMPQDGTEPYPAYPLAAYPWAWRELHTLGGRMLFVGRGCSRSYEADQYPGFSDGIYFFDDGEFYDEAVIFRNANERQYFCSDNGKWSGGHVQRCFPLLGPTNYSPPAWLLP